MTNPDTTPVPILVTPCFDDEGRPSCGGCPFLQRYETVLEAGATELCNLDDVYIYADVPHKHCRIHNPEAREKPL